MRSLALAAMAALADNPEQPSGVLDAARSGDLLAFERLMRQYERLVLVTALRLSGNLPFHRICAMSSPSSGNPPKMSRFSIRNATVSEDGTTIRIDRMHAGLKIPVTFPGGKGVEYTDSGIDQDVDVKEGQKVVVGRSSLEGPQQALFLILTAHVIQ